MTPSFLVAAAAFAALTSLVPAASADDCTDIGRHGVRAGSCTYSDSCASAYADATPQIMDDTFVVWGCAGSDTHVCFGYARANRCTDDRP